MDTPATRDEEERERPLLANIFLGAGCPREAERERTPLEKATLISDAAAERAEASKGGTKDHAWEPLGPRMEGPVKGSAREEEEGVEDWPKTWERKLTKKGAAERPAKLAMPRLIFRRWSRIE